MLNAQLLVMIAEADLYKEWVPFMETSREIVGSGYRKIVYIKIGLPWPFEARDSVCILLVAMTSVCLAIIA